MTQSGAGWWVAAAAAPLMYPWSRVPAGARWVAGGRHEHTRGARLKDAASYCYVFMEHHSFADPDSRGWGAGGP